MARIFSLFFKSDRAACIEQIRKIGIEGHTNPANLQAYQTGFGYYKY